MSLTPENKALVEQYAPWTLAGNDSDYRDLEALLNAARAQGRSSMDGVTEAQNAQIRSITTLATELADQVRDAQGQTEEGWRPKPGDTVEHASIGARGVVQRLMLSAFVRWFDGSTCAVPVRSLSPAPHPPKASASCEGGE